MYVRVRVILTFLYRITVRGLKFAIFCARVMQTGFLFARVRIRTYTCDLEEAAHKKGSGKEDIAVNFLRATYSQTIYTHAKYV